jgi:hypothetical protein
LGNIATQFCHTQAFAPVAVPFAAGGLQKNDFLPAAVFGSGRQDTYTGDTDKPTAEKCENTSLHTFQGWLLNLKHRKVPQTGITK